MRRREIAIVFVGFFPILSIIVFILVPLWTRFFLFKIDTVDIRYSKFIWKKEKFMEARIALDRNNC